MRIAILNWRDTSNPEGGGSEVYIEQIARRLVARGHEVTLVCARHGAAAALEVREGVRIVRQGSKLTVYREARRLLRSGALGELDVVVDTQNGIPFLAPWAVDLPVVVLVHHVHREQWPVVYDPVRARVGWWIESVAAPRIYRQADYVTVSQATRDELIPQGIDAARISIVHNGVEPLPAGTTPRSPSPRILVLGRLVPHKRVEHVLAAAQVLRHEIPGLRVSVVGDGWWSARLRLAAADLGVDDIVDFAGHVDDETKAAELRRAWVLALPSLKEGWGIVVLEAAAAGTPTVAYRDAGGVRESIDDGRSGLLVESDLASFTDGLRRILTDDELRESLGDNARCHAERFSWEESALAFERTLERAVASWSRRRRRKGRLRWPGLRSAKR